MGGTVTIDDSTRFSRPVNLADLRKRIDAIDESILTLFAERAGLVRHVQNLKRTCSMPVRSYEREEEMFARARGIARRLGIAGDDAVALIRQCIVFCLDSAGADAEVDKLDTG